MLQSNFAHLNSKDIFHSGDFHGLQSWAARKMWNDEFGQEMLDHWECYGKRLQLLKKTMGLRGGEIDRVLPFSPLQQKLERMQSNLIW